MVPLHPVAGGGNKSRHGRNDERFMVGRRAAGGGFYQPLIKQIRTPVRTGSHSAQHSFCSASLLSTFQISGHRKITLLHCSLSLPPLSISSIISHLLGFKSSGLSLTAYGSSKTNGSLLHLLLITPHPPSLSSPPLRPHCHVLLFCAVPLFPALLLLFFSSLHKKKKEREAGQLGVNRLMFWQFEIHPWHFNPASVIIATDSRSLGVMEGWKSRDGEREERRSGSLWECRLPPEMVGQHWQKERNKDSVENENVAPKWWLAEALWCQRTGGRLNWRWSETRRRSSAWN